MFIYFTAGSASTVLQCYAGKKGWKYQECYKSDGFKTCFTKYENGWFVVNFWDEIFRTSNNICPKTLESTLFQNY